MTDSYDEKIREGIRAIRTIDAEADEIKNLIKDLSKMDQASREKVLATVKVYYELGAGISPEELKAIQERMATETENMRKRLELADQFRSVEQAARCIRIPTAPTGDEDDEEHRLLNLVERFSSAMFDKLLAKMRDGHYGWDYKGNMDILIEGYKKHCARGGDATFEESNLVDIANFCAFIWNLRKK
jgi:hypothetical protein